MPGVALLRLRGGAFVRIPVALCLFFGLAGTIPAGETVFSTVLRGSGQEFATSVASDAMGNTYVVGLTYSADFPVTTGAFQTAFGGTCDAFLTKVGTDGKVIWSTYLGGILDDWASGVALDGSGNVLVTGYTRSANFPLVNPIQSTLNGGASDDYDAFVAKFDPTGANLLYSTLLGGQDIDGAAGIAVDTAGNAYVAVNSNSATGFPGVQNGPNQFGILVSKLTPRGALVYTNFHPYGNAGGIALDASGAAYIAGWASSNNPASATQSFGVPGAQYAIAYKISPDGSKKVYETALGGSVQANAAAIAVNSAGEAYIAGSTSSVDFPLAHPYQTSPGARPLWKSTDSGTTWTPIDNLPFALPQVMVLDPGTPTTQYQATGDLGIFKSLDGGVTWNAASSGIAGTNVSALAIDPVRAQTLYAATATAVYKSTDGANTWSAIDSLSAAVTILVDAQNPNIVYEAGANIRKSTDGGITWNSVTFPGTVNSMALDPRVSGHIFATSNPVYCGIFCGNSQPPYLYRSVDGGATWIQIQSVPQAIPPTLLVDSSTNPSTVYDGLAFRSVDGGVSWTAIGNLPFPVGYTSLAADPSGNLYASPSGGYGNFVSRDQAQTWTAIGSFLPPWPSETAGPSVVSIVPAGSTGTVYATTNQVATSGFISKLSADGSTLQYSTYLRGHASMNSFSDLLAEPAILQTQSWISGIALDAAGDMIVAGGTRSADLPTANPAQAANAGLADAFAALLSPDGSKLNYATYYGGSHDDGALAVGVDFAGNVIFAGQTFSGDFPVPGGSALPYTFGDSYVVKLAPDQPSTPSVTAVLNGASYQPGIEAGSWVMIQGSNLAGITRTWTSADFVNGSLPTSLSGVSVTIDGKPAFVYYISSTQINVLAPSDSALGAVNVVVDNNGSLSAPATAQLQAVAPALFVSLGNAIASSLPNYSAIGTPSAPAHPGDTLVLWGTGFGVTNPAVVAGTVVSGAPAAITAPTVTIGSVSVPVLSTVLAAGSAGLYQIAIQLPANVPLGAVAVRASIGTVATQSGVTLFVAAR